MKTQTKTYNRGAIQFTGLIFSLVTMIVLTSCQTKKTKQQIASLEFSKDSLVMNIHQRDSILGDMMNAFGQIEESLEYIKNQRKLISSTTDDPELSENKKDQIVKDVQTLAAMLEQNTKKLNSLNKQLKSSGIKIASLEKRIQDLTIETENRNNDIIALKSELEKKDFEISQLNTQVADLSDTKVKQEGVIEKQTSELNELNTAYFTAGTAKELKEKGLITKEGGFLGLGKIKTLSPTAKNEYFSTFDIRNTVSLPVKADQAKLITDHPAGSYKFVKENEQIAALEISNAKEFYKYSKYIVMEIKQ